MTAIYETRYTFVKRFNGPVLIHDFVCPRPRLRDNITTEDIQNIERAAIQSALRNNFTLVLVNEEETALKESLGYRFGLIANGIIVCETSFVAIQAMKVLQKNGKFGECGMIVAEVI